MNKDLYELSYSMKKDLQKKVSFALLLILSVIFIINVILVYIVFPVHQTSCSMEPDIPNESFVMFTPILSSYERGDVVLLKSRSYKKQTFRSVLTDRLVGFFSAQQFYPSKSNKIMGDSDLIRRVIGVPGDEIYMRDYVIYVRPAGEKFFLTEFELIEKNYNVEINPAPALWDNSLGVSGSFETITLKDDEYFVLGDMRNSTVDSRLWGPLNEKEIKASALFVYLPLNKFKLF